MTFIVAPIQRKAIENGEPVPWSVLVNFLAGALPHFWEECLELSETLRRGQEEPRLDISLFAIEPARQIRLGMALTGYREAAAEHFHCSIAMPNASTIAVLPMGHRLVQPPTAAFLPAVIQKDRSSGFAAFRDMANTLKKNGSFLMRSMAGMDIRTSQDLITVFGTDPYRDAMQEEFRVCVAMQNGRIAMKPWGSDSPEFDEFCKVEQLIAAWPDRLPLL